MSNAQEHYSPALKQMQTVKGCNNLEYYFDGLDGMMEDTVRNKFYDEILKECKGKCCIDVGAGSGLLAFLALKHGAKKVICFEQNSNSARHIEQCRKRMRIPSSRIKVINDEFRVSRWNRGDYDLPNNIDIVFHEILGSYIWNELMLNTFDEDIFQNHPCYILPRNYTIKYSVVVPKLSLYRQLIDYQHNLCEDRDLVQGKFGDYKEFQNQLDVGVDIDKEFVTYYQMVRHNRRFEVLAPFRLKTIPHCKLLDTLFAKSKIIHVAHSNINDRSTLHNIEFDLPQLNTGYLLMINPIVEHNGITFDFRESTSFTGCGRPIVVPQPKEYKFKKFYYNIFKKELDIDNFKLA